MIMVAVPLRHDTKEHHAARHTLQHIREIFCNHERRRHRDVIMLADQLGGYAACEIHEPRVVDCDRIAPFMSISASHRCAAAIFAATRRMP